MGVKHHACAMVLVAGLVALAEPQDALSFVRHNRLELRLRALSDVELEVTQGRQTLNRLLLKSELQAARARLGTTPAPPSVNPGQRRRNAAVDGCHL